MAAVLSLGTLKSAGCSTLALTLAGAAAEAGASVTLIDAARDADLVRWGEMGGRPAGIAVVRASDGDKRRKGRDRCFVATSLTPIPSRIARLVEMQVEACRTPRLAIGLALRAAFEPPFLFGGTIHTLSPDAAPGLDRARENAVALARAAGLSLGVADDAARTVRKAA